MYVLRADLSMMLTIRYVNLRYDKMQANHAFKKDVKIGLTVSEFIVSNKVT